MEATREESASSPGEALHTDILASWWRMDHKLEDGGVQSAPYLNTGVRPRNSQQGMAGTGIKKW